MGQRGTRPAADASDDDDPPTSSSDDTGGRDLESGSEFVLLINLSCENQTASALKVNATFQTRCAAVHFVSTNFSLSFTPDFFVVRGPDGEEIEYVRPEDLPMRRMLSPDCVGRWGSVESSSPLTKEYDLTRFYPSIASLKAGDVIHVKFRRDTMDGCLDSEAFPTGKKVSGSTAVPTDRFRECELVCEELRIELMEP